MFVRFLMLYSVLAMTQAADLPDRAGDIKPSLISLKVQSKKNKRQYKEQEPVASSSTDVDIITPVETNPKKKTTKQIVRPLRETAGLPVEVWLIISDYLDLHSLVNLSLVNKGLNAQYGGFQRISAFHEREINQSRLRDASVKNPLPLEEISEKNLSATRVVLLVLNRTAVSGDYAAAHKIMEIVRKNYQAYGLRFPYFIGAVHALTSTRKVITTWQDEAQHIDPNLKNRLFYKKDRRIDLNQPCMTATLLTLEGSALVYYLVVDYLNRLFKIQTSGQKFERKTTPLYQFWKALRPTLEKQSAILFVYRERIGRSEDLNIEFFKEYDRAGQFVTFIRCVKMLKKYKYFR